MALLSIKQVPTPLQVQNTDTDQPSGMTDRAETTIAFNDGNQTLTVAKVGASFSFWSKGLRFVKTVNQTKQIAGGDLANDTLYYFYFDTTGTLTYGMTFLDLKSGISPVAMVYWNGAAGALQDERHLASRDIDWHIWTHLTIGTRYQDGLAGTFNADGTFSISQGSIWDEELEHDTGGAETSALIWYRNNAGAKITFDASASASVWKLNGAVLRYDSAGVLTDIDNGKYGVSWVYATNDDDDPIYVVLGQAQYATATLANEAALPTFPTTMPTAEMKLLYKVVYRQTGAATQAVTGSVDYRTAMSLPMGATPNPVAGSVTFTPNGATTATNVQQALDGLYDTQTIAAATGELLVGVRYCLVDYTTTNPVTDIEWTAASTTAKQITTFYDVDKRAGTNNITIQNTAGTVLGTIVEDGGSLTLGALDGVNVVVLDN